VEAGPILRALDEPSLAPWLRRYLRWSSWGLNLIAHDDGLIPASPELFAPLVELARPPGQVRAYAALNWRVAGSHDRQQSRAALSGRSGWHSCRANALTRIMN
jgi:hypothetical protein